MTLYKLAGPPVIDVFNDTLDEGATLDLGPDAIFVFDPDDADANLTMRLAGAPTNGTVTLDGVPLAELDEFSALDFLDGRVAYTHDGSETIDDILGLDACDALGYCSPTYPVRLVITPVNDLPVLAPDTLTVLEGGVATADVLVNDTDAETDLTVLNVSVTPPTFGQAVVALGGIRYEHDGSEGPTDEVRYTVCDDDGGCVDSLLTVTVTPVNDPPVATADDVLVDEGGTVEAPVVANDVDPDDVLDPSAVTLVSGPFHGMAVATAAGLSYTHDGSETPSDELTYAICDAAGLCAEATLTLAVTPINDAPLAVDDSAAVDEGGSVDVNLLANDVDADSTLEAVTLDTAPAHGTVTLVGGLATYQHDGSEAPDDAFTYTVCDPDGACGSANVTVQVTAIDDAPVAFDDALTVIEGGSASVDVRANDSDADSPAPAVSAGAAAHGQVSVSGGVLTYVHDGSETLSDVVPYTLCDGTTCVEAQVAVTITPANDAPVAVDDVFVVDGVVTLSANDGVLANDSDAEGGLTAEVGACGCRQWVFLGLSSRRRKIE